ncbi:phosphoglycerate dehydrogenase [Thalassospira sp. HF15]|uniref:NAD(P)-dependent oxidoreductase n=1 Tax=Thalassospira sp. HF15 TaxID=2722755 RepID=UPI001431BA85|nr:NAD(P)-dependent oxidoreductase [Thalassospira sp. HF15]NIY75316.1 phosphoglycerate dehydrogenase [Thalassospira sp. HF15]
MSKDVSSQNPATQNNGFKVLIADLVGLKFDDQGVPDCSEVAEYIVAKGGVFHPVSDAVEGVIDDGKIHFYYRPNISTEDEIIAITEAGNFDALIAAATFIPAKASFPRGGVRIGAGTGNMGALCWGGGNGDGGTGVLMNTPGINSRATAQMVFKALLRTVPDIDLDTLHERVVAKTFDTGKNLKDFPTSKLEGCVLGVIGYGNIGREVAKLGRSFGMEVRIYARERHKKWIEAEGFVYAPTILDAARGADVLTPHVGLGAFDADAGTYANAHLINAEVLNVLAPGAVLVNFDRGELVDAAALDQALASGAVRYAAIDADLFLNEQGDVSGPMVPYLPLETHHKGKLLLLPHAAADTDHPSRVAGGKQAVDQIFGLLLEKSVSNVRGTLPQGYTDLGVMGVPGVGAVSSSQLSGLVADTETLDALIGDLRALLGSLEQLGSLKHARRTETSAEVSEQFVLNANRTISKLRKAGIEGPFRA